MTDVRQFLPQSKFDTERADLLVELGYPAVASVLPELIEWLQDYNWPVAHIFAPLLAGIGRPLLPHIRRVLATDDDIWKYCILFCLVEGNPNLVQDLEPELSRLATSPTRDEAAEELDRKAQEILSGMRG